jgi:hypothetical protein
MNEINISFINNMKYILSIFVVVIILLGFIVFIHLIGLNLNQSEPQKKLIEVVTLEGFDTDIEMNKSDSFCKSHIGSSDLLNESCNKLTQKNCNSTSCCLWTSNNKCVAGSENGPTYNTDKNGKTINLDYYYYKNKCYGTKCPW